MIRQKNIIKRILCNHNKDIFVRNIYGDEINACNKRSVWQCSKCGSFRWSDYLNKNVKGNPFSVFEC